MIRVWNTLTIDQPKIIGLKFEMMTPWAVVYLGSNVRLVEDCHFERHWVATLIKRSTGLFSGRGFVRLG